MITTCPGLAVQRNRLFSEFEELCTKTKTNIVFADILEREEELCQFILDPTSLNLPTRVSLNDPLVPQFYKLSRDFCHIIDKTRIGSLRELEKMSK